MNQGGYPGSGSCNLLQCWWLSMLICGVQSFLAFLRNVFLFKHNGSELFYYSVWIPYQINHNFTFQIGINVPRILCFGNISSSHSQNFREMEGGGDGSVGCSAQLRHKMEVPD